MCDSENLSRQGLVQDSENHEVESPGTGGSYDSVIPQVSVKGKLSKSIAFWHSIGVPDFILSVIRDGYKIPFISTPPPHHCKNNSSALEERGFVTEAISELLRDNRVEEIFSPPDIVNPLSVSVQANGKKRLILDLRHINLHIFKEKFKCEGLHTIKSALSKNYFVFLFDLKAGYHHVDIFRTIANIWFSRGILAQVLTDIFNLRFYLLGFLVLLSFSQSS